MLQKANKQSIDANTDSYSTTAVALGAKAGSFGDGFTVWLLPCISATYHSRWQKKHWRIIEFATAQ